jgi:hypothetical protein
MSSRKEEKDREPLGLVPALYSTGFGVYPVSRLPATMKYD